MSRIFYLRCNCILVLVVLLVLVTTTWAQLYEGDSCTQNNGAPGICRLLQQCKAAQEAIRRGQFPVRCGFNGVSPVVCCSQRSGGAPPSNSPTPTPARPGRPGVAGVAPSRPSRPPAVQPPPTTATRPPPQNSAGLASAVTLNAESKSSQKCTEYAKSVYQLVARPTLTNDEIFDNRSTCAITVTPLVVGGQPAELHEYPHMALLGYGPNISNPAWYCGGSLISENFVMTAAHCMSTRDEGPVSVVRLGELEISNPNDGSQTQNIRVAERIPHPDYRPPARYNDIALLRLERPATFNAGVRPACIHCAVSIPDPSKDIKLVATGWGRVGFDEDTSDRLLKVSLSLIPHATCNHAYRTEATTSKLRNGIDDRSMVCAGEQKGGKDTCQGDSGGPLQLVLTTPHCMYCVAGIVSFGKFCGYSNSPAVYTRVEHYRDWIERVVWP